MSLSSIAVRRSAAATGTERGPKMYEKPKALTVADLMAVLVTLPPDCLVQTLDYGEDFRPIWVTQLTSVSDEGFLNFEFTDMSHALPEEEDTWWDADEDDAVGNPPEPAGTSVEQPGP